MATSASQPYIAKLGFQDKDRGKDRHGLACEYLTERLTELAVIPHLLRRTVESSRYDFPEPLNPNDPKTQEYIFEALACLKSGPRINVPIGSKSYVKGFADVLLPMFSVHFGNGSCLYESEWKILGEVKISKEPAENVLQQINFYMHTISTVRETYVLTDYDCADLQRLVEGTNIKVFRLGQRFEKWIASRPQPATQEL